MRICAGGNAISVNNHTEMNVLHNVPEDSNERNDINNIPVRVSISKEGIESYRDSLQKESESHDSVWKGKSDFQPGIILTDCAFEFGNKLSSLKEEGTSQSLEDMASDLLKTYAGVYDDIVRGYESGTRENYVADPASESGYRKMTMSEEIDALNAVYNRWVEHLDTQAQLRPKMTESLKEYADTLSRIAAKSEKAAEKANKAYDEYFRLKEGMIPENISEKMISASKIFVEQYTKQAAKNRDIESILCNIHIF